MAEFLADCPRVELRRRTPAAVTFGPPELVLLDAELEELPRRVPAEAECPAVLRGLFGGGAVREVGEEPLEVRLLVFLLCLGFDFLNAPEQFVLVRVGVPLDHGAGQVVLDPLPAVGLDVPARVMGVGVGPQTDLSPRCRRPLP